jgi:hypothetical protein
MTFMKKKLCPECQQYDNCGMKWRSKGIMSLVASIFKGGKDVRDVSAQLRIPLICIEGIIREYMKGKIDDA